jgi:hypothetical protein
VCEGDYTYTWTLYGLRRKLTGLCTYGDDRVCPFPAIPPTSDVVDCYANIVLPAPPVVLITAEYADSNRTCRNRKCSVRRAIILIPGRIQTVKAILRIMLHTVTIEYAPFPAIAPTTTLLIVMQYCITGSSGITITAE